MTSSKRLLAAATLGNDPGDIHIYASDNNGVTWSHKTSFEGGLNIPIQSSFLCWPTNIATIAYASDADLLRIKRSTNDGDSWSTVAEFPSTRVGLGILLDARKGASYGQTGGLYTGATSTDSFVADKNIFSTTNKGLNWSDSFFPPPSGTRAPFKTVAAGSQGRMIIVADQLRLDTPPDFTTLRVAQTENNGGSWSWSDPIGRPTSSTFCRMETATYLTREIILAGGDYAPGSLSSGPALWRTTNNGTSWSLITGGSIASNPLTKGDASCAGLKRITRDSAIMAVIPSANESLAPWRISKDAGATWPIIPTMTGSGLGSFNFSLATMVVAPRARVIAEVTRADGSGTISTLCTIDLQC